MSLCVYFPICTLGMGRETERERTNERERAIGREGAKERRRGREREERSVISELINSLHIANDAHTEPWRPQRSMRAENPFVWFLSEGQITCRTMDNRFLHSKIKKRLDFELVTST